MKITKKMTIGEILDKCPNAASIMFENGMHCIGCHLAISESFEDGCKAHGISEGQIDKMIKEINKLIEKT